ncbi:MAG: hypothetical protein WCK54_18945 [Desulfuromonadales bacterium]
MFGSTMLEVAIGLALVYLLLSLICTALQAESFGQGAGVDCVGWG